MYHRLKSILLFLLLLGPFIASATEPQINLVGVGGIFPPHAYIDKVTHKCTGNAVRKMLGWLEHAGYKVKPMCIPSARSYKMLEQGHADFTINIKSTLAIKDFVSFVGPKVTTFKLNVYRAKSKDNHFSIAAVRGYNYAGLRQKYENEGFRFVDLPESSSAIRLFVAGKVNYLLAYQGPFEYFLDQNDITIDFEYDTNTIFSADAYLAVSKKSQFHDNLVEYFSDFDGDE